jgi:AcrR family transcriptional regulator
VLDETKRFRFISRTSQEPHVTPAVSTAPRPRVEGERENAIFDATMRLLATAGYDRLTMDAVAAEARASKATLYRRWVTKADLVVDALVWLKSCMPHEIPDTGSLRSDLLTVACTEGGLTDRMPRAVFGALITAMQRDEALAVAFRQRFLAPLEARTRTMLERARARGEIADDVDLALLGSVLPSVAVFRALTQSGPVGPELIEQIVDEVVLPACRGRGPSTG